MFNGNRADVTTLEVVMRMVERKYGKARRIWVMDRGIVSEANLATIRKREGQYLVGTPRSKMKEFEPRLQEETGWEQVRDEVQVKLIPIPGGQETFILCKTEGRQRACSCGGYPSCRKRVAGKQESAVVVPPGPVKPDQRRANTGGSDHEPVLSADFGRLDASPGLVPSQALPVQICPATDSKVGYLPRKGQVFGFTRNNPKAGEKIGDSGCAAALANHVPNPGV